MEEQHVWKLTNHSHSFRRWPTQLIENSKLKVPCTMYWKQIGLQNPATSECSYPICGGLNKLFSHILSWWEFRQQRSGILNTGMNEHKVSLWPPKISVEGKRPPTWQILARSPNQMHLIGENTAPSFVISNTLRLTFRPLWPPMSHLKASYWWAGMLEEIHLPILA
jgi:hypothetical protein